MSKKRCARCGRAFEPVKAYYRYCGRCFGETQSVGGTSVGRQRGGADHRHGGTSRLRSERRSVILRGHRSRETILSGLQGFLSELYDRRTGLGTLMANGGMTIDEIDELNTDAHLNCVVMDFCPALSSWLIDVLDYRSADLIIDFYGLYGYRPVPISKLAVILNLNDTSHAHNRLNWAMRQLKEPECQGELEQLAVKVGREVLLRGHG